MEEVWKPTSYTDKYEISNLGKLRLKSTENIRKLQLKEGKLYASLVAHGKDFKCNIAREVLKVFVRDAQGNENAYHRNGNNIDNRVDNLEWRPAGTNVRASSSDAKRSTGGADEPGDDIVKKTIKFGDKTVTVSADGWVKPGESRWKKVTTVRGGYLRTSFQFDRDGNTRRNDEGKVLSQYFELHRLVCEAFHGPPPKAYDAHHINEVKSDNRPENLEWRSRSENMKASYEGGFNTAANEKATYQYTTRGEFTGKVYKSASEAARSARGVVSGVTSCCKGNKLSYMEFEWSYLAPAEYAKERVVMQARARERNKEAVNKRREKNGPPKSTGKPIFAYDATTFEPRGSWPSGKAAAADTKCNTANISNCVNGRLKQTGGFIFTRSDEETFRAEREVDN